MNEGSSHITVILDRSGSMEGIRDDIIGGFNTFLDQQKQEPDKATFTLVQFDSQDRYEVVHRFKPIQDIPPLTRDTFIPRANTPLLDTIGRGINDLEQSLSSTPDAARPARIVFAILTDGQENDSSEFTRSMIIQKIKEKSEAGWQFAFLSADLAAIEEVLELGVQRDSSYHFAKSPDGSTAAFMALSKQTSNYRSRRKAKFGFDPGDAASAGKGKS